MGWTFHRGATKASMVEHLLSERHHKTVAHALRGNVLWAVKEYTREEQTIRYIACFLLRSGNGECGYKDIEESMGPNEVSCPLYFFDLVPEPKGQYGAAWRARVRASQDQHRVKRSFIKSLRPGQDVQLVAGCSPPRVK